MRRTHGDGLRRTALAGGIVLTLLAAAGAAEAPAGTPLHVFAPWSLEKRLRRTVEPFQERSATTPVRFTTGTPGKLIKRVKGGARPDVYIAMGPGEIEVLEQLGLAAPGTGRVLLKQTLVLAVAETARDRVKDLRDLARKDIAAVGMGRPSLTAGRLTRAALAKLGILAAVERKARTSPLRSLVVGDVQAAVIYEQCCYEEDLFVGAEVPRRGIAVAVRLPRRLCEPFPVIAVALRTQLPHPSAPLFVRVLGEKRAQDILHRRGEWSCPICEMEP